VLRIDVFCHILPPRYLEERNRRAGKSFGTQYARYYTANQGLTDLGIRFRILDQFPDVRQLLTIAGPNVESITAPADAVELARIANDELAELVAKHPDRFIAAAACLPMSDVDAALREAERAIHELHFCGVEVFTDINGRPVDAPELLPLYEKMQALDLPILLHPRRTNTTPDYPGEATSKFLIYTNFGWPFETSKAMARLAFGGVLERFPRLKIVTHHAGGMIPFFHKRVDLSWDFNVRLMGYQGDGQAVPASPVERYRLFYCDTAIQGNTAALMCAYDFFGADRMVFATDSPYDDERGARVYRETIPAVEAMPIGAEEKAKIFEGNARRLFRLSRDPGSIVSQP
jgi:predicted TIM-barrel fold metal-dependent hydrolase